MIYNINGYLQTCIYKCLNIKYITNYIISVFKRFVI